MFSFIPFVRLYFTFFAFDMKNFSVIHIMEIIIIISMVVVVTMVVVVAMVVVAMVE